MTFIAPDASATDALITDFTPNSADLGWYVVNDNVMGGQSEGSFEQLQQIGSGPDDQNRGPGANLGAVTQRLEIMLALNAVDKALEKFLADRRDQIDWEMRRDLNAFFNEIRKK